MPYIFDNIDLALLPTLRESLQDAYRADFCVGYFNLRGWASIADSVEHFTGGEGQQCRLLIGMQRLPQEELREALNPLRRDLGIDNQTAARLKSRLAREFRAQLTFGVPTDEDERALRQLAAQLRARRVVVKLHLRYPLHAKLYLAHREDHATPILGYLGSSNLTMAGLSKQGELNIDVVESDAAAKLAQWFEDRWMDGFAIDITDELAQIIEESWAREDLLSPYLVYLKMAYHLSQEAREGLSEFKIPRVFEDRLFDFQVAAVKIAAHHLNKRGGVVIGDVVGLGKTLMATALARIFEDDWGVETLIICPKNLVNMWEAYRLDYGLRAKVMSITTAQRDLTELRRFRLVIIDESHNLRNREGARYKAVWDYVQKNDSLCILLSATPYNKSYLDLSSQLRLFLGEDQDLGIRPEVALRQLGEVEFVRRHQCGLRTLAAFEKSEFAEDWRELMRLYMVRRTRGFIRDNYGTLDPDSGRRYLTMSDGGRSYFPDRVPKTVRFSIDESDPQDQYAQMYAPGVVSLISELHLPRYGLGQYVLPDVATPDRATADILDNLSAAGQRLIGFARTNLFKRLESSGHAFMLSVERHIVRNYVYLYAMQQSLPLPIGTQDVATMDSRRVDLDSELPMFGEEGVYEVEEIDLRGDLWQEAVTLYELYRQKYQRKFKWLDPTYLDQQSLYQHLEGDSAALLGVLNEVGTWDPARDAKLIALRDLLAEQHPEKKVLVFSQFADTVTYLEAQLQPQIAGLAGVTGQAADPTDFARRFSPASNGGRDKLKAGEELRVLIATDVLSEGQNLQDAAIVVNYDLPWAIIRLIQRAGRVDRIGQQADRIHCYTFLPAEGVERIIRLRGRVRQRLQQNAEVVGTDEMFFEDDRNDQRVRDLYSEAAGVLDDAEDEDVDLASFAWQIWHNATQADPGLEARVKRLENVAFATRDYSPSPDAPEGALVYVRTGQGNDALAWIDRQGRSVTESQYAILRAAACGPETPPRERLPEHHTLVLRGLERVAAEESSGVGALGRPSGARFKVYERLARYQREVQGTLFASEELDRAIDDIYRYPLRETAKDTLNRQLKAGLDDMALAQLVLELRQDNRLSNITEEGEVQREPQIVCSMGLRQPEEQN